MRICLRRREFITFLGGAAAALPMAAHPQQSARPVIGLLHGGSPEAFSGRMAAFRQGLSEAGFTENRNVTIEYRWANYDEHRLSELAVDLVNRRVAVIATPGGGVSAGGAGAATVAKGATATIPIVFSTGSDPVQLGLVASLNRPGGNATGFNDMNSVLTPKRLGILFELLPKATRFAVLINPTAPDLESVSTEIKAAPTVGGRQIDIVYAATSHEIETAFMTLAQRRIEALAVHTNPFFNSHRIQLITLAAHHHLPAIYPWRETPEVGGLMFYGTSSADEYRQVGIYVGRVLKGEKPADLPVIRATQFELVINLQTARVLGIEVPATLRALADEIIE
jgi:putative ABC transport system substrate-binding protein